MSYKSASTSIISAGTTESSQSRSFNYPDGPGVVITGSQVTSESASYKMIVEAGQGQTFTVIGGGGGANITIDGIDYLDSSNVVAGNAVSTLGGNILIRGSGFAGDLRVIVGGSAVSNSIINTAAIFSTLSANSAGNVDLFIFEGSNVGVISPEQVRYSGAPVWTTTSFEVTEGIAANIELVASSDSTLTYSILSGSGNLPVGLSLVSSGYISGTANGYVAGGSGQVTIVATDQEDQASQQVITWTVLSAADQNFYRTVLSLNADGVEPFTKDASDNNFQLTVVGDTQPNRMSPYWPGGWSAYFDGSGDYLTFPQNVEFNLGTVDFTIEGWIYYTSTSGNLPVFAIDATSYPSVLIQSESGNLKAYATSASASWNILNGASFGNISSNTWYHFALTRSGSSFRLFLNGVLNATVTSSISIENQGGTGRIGASDGAGTMIGYISNLRVVKGTAVYTENFTPPTTPLEPIAGTSLLTLRDPAFVDDGPYRFTITRAGDTKITTVSPFNTQPYTITPDSYSGYFDGSGDGLSITTSTFNRSAWTIETWCYLPSNSTAALFDFPATTTTYGILCLHTSGSLNFEVFSTTSSGSKFVSLSYSFSSNNLYNTWVHVATTFDGSVYRYFINGSLVGSVNSTTLVVAPTVWSIGARGDGTQSWIGYISNFRVSNSAVYTSNFTPPTAPLSAISGTSLLTCQNSTFVDNSTNAFAITANGNSQPTTFNPFGETVTTISDYSYDSSLYSASAYFDGGSDCVTAPANAAFTLGTSDLTVEFWWYGDGAAVNPYATHFKYSSGVTQQATNDFYLNMGSATGGFISVLVGSGGAWGVNMSPGGATYYNLSINNWNHIAVTRSGSTWRLFWNGQQISTATYAGSISAQSGPMVIGSSSAAGGDSVKGYISNFRFIKGTALYTGPFVPPAQPLTAVTNTSLLTLQRDLDVDNSAFVDVSPNNLLITRTGNVTQGSASPYAPSGWSVYFDGSGDYLQFAGNNILPTGTENFTVEFWFNQTKAFASSNQANYITTASTNGGLQLWINAAEGKIRLGAYAVAAVIDYSYSTISLNVWNHFAVTRSGNTFTMYLNGVQVATATSTVSFVAPGTSYIGSGSYGGYISNMRVVRGSVVYTENFTPPTAPLSAINGTSLLTCQSPSLVDNGPNRLAITRAGDAKIVPLSPFVPQTVTPNSYSGYFDGSGDYLTAPSSSSLSLGSGDYTVEAWVYLTGTQTNNFGWGVLGTYPGSGNGWSLTINQSNNAQSVRWILGNAVVASAPTPYIPLYTWTHIAVIRSGSSTNNTKIFINGILSGQATNNTDDTFTGTFYIGSQGVGILLTGHISNARVVKGTAVYTSNFTPPTAPLSAISGTSLLTCQNTTFVDNSTNAFAITANGNAQPTTFNPFGSTVVQDATAYTDSSGAGSAYFDGTGEYLTASSSFAFAFGTESFTIEFWVYLTAYTSYPAGAVFTPGSSNNNIDIGGISNLPGKLVYWNGSSSLETGAGIVTLNEWQHIAFVRNNTAVTFYRNGIVVASGTLAASNQTSATTASVGGNSSRSVIGYLSNLRVVKGTALYTGPFVPPAQPLTAVTNTSLLLPMTNGAIYDATERNLLETVGNTRIDTSVKKFGTGSMYFDGTGDYLVVNSPDPSLFAFGTGDFTIEFWVNPASSSATYVFYDSRPTSTNGGYLLIYQTSSTVRVYINTADRITGGALTANAWNHVAVTRSGTSTKLFINGTQSGSTYTDSTNYLGASNRPLICSNGYNPGTDILNGYIDDLRITKGYARYVANFTPPDIPNPAY